MSYLMKNPLPYEPKRKNRWNITLPKELEFPTEFIIASERPKLRLTAEVVEALPISITFSDPIAPSTSQKLQEIFVGLTGYDVWGKYDKRFTDYYESIKEKYLPFIDGFDYQLELFGPVGDSVELWDIKGCKITKLSFGDLGYDSTEDATCTLQLLPKAVILQY